MTRINVIDPRQLTDQHLLSEYRELPRALGLVRRPGDPESYRLGKGHVRFFAGKENWLRRRQAALVAELVLRGFNPQHRDVPAPLGPDEWQAGREARVINLTRLRERLAAKPSWYRYRGKPVEPGFYGGGFY